MYNNNNNNNSIPRPTRVLEALTSATESKRVSLYNNPEIAPQQVFSIDSVVLGAKDSAFHFYRLISIMPPDSYRLPDTIPCMIMFIMGCKAAV